MRKDPPNLTIVESDDLPVAALPPSDEQAEPISFQDLEPFIRDLERAARLAWQLALQEHCNGYDKDLGSLALLVAEDVDKRAGELRKFFYEAYKTGRRAG